MANYTGYLKDKNGNNLAVGNLLPIAEKTLTVNSSELSLTGLNLEPGIYKIYVAEWSTTNTTGGHFVSINDIKTDYSTRIIFNENTSSMVINDVTNGIALTNGWGGGTKLFYTELTLFYYDKQWVGAQTTLTTNGRMVIQNGSLQQAINNINKIAITPKDNDLIGHGSYIKLYQVI